MCAPSAADRLAFEMRRLAPLICVWLSIVACGGPTISRRPSIATGGRETSQSPAAEMGESPSPPPAAVEIRGVLLLSGEEGVQAAPRDEGQATAFSAAIELAEANGSDLGYPWIDPSNGDLVLSAVTPRGGALIAPAVSVPHS